MKKNKRLYNHANFAPARLEIQCIQMYPAHSMIILYGHSMSPRNFPMFFGKRMSQSC